MILCFSPLLCYWITLFIKLSVPRHIMLLGYFCLAFFIFICGGAHDSKFVFFKVAQLWFFCGFS